MPPRRGGDYSVVGGSSGWCVPGGRGVGEGGVGERKQTKRNVDGK